MATALVAALVAGAPQSARAQVTYTSYQFSTLAGTAGIAGSADGTGAAARFNAPQGVAVDASGTLYIADNGNNVIRAVSPSGVVTTIAGTAGVTGSADGTGATAQFNSPAGIAVDGAGNLYVADMGNDTIREISPAGVVTTLAGTAGVTGSADGAGASAQFKSPHALAVDASGNVFVADTNNCAIRKITPAGATTTFAGTPVSGYQDGPGASALFSYPNGLAIDGTGNVYVADTGNNSIREISPAGMVSTPVGGFNRGGYSHDGVGTGATFDGPDGIAVDGSGNVFVTEFSDNVVRKIAPGAVVTTIAGIRGIFGAADGIGPSVYFRNPFGVAVDASSRVYVTDQTEGTVRKGVAVAQGAATITLGDLYQAYDGSPKAVSVTTNPPGLATTVVYGGFLYVPSEVGTYPIFATIVDPAYTGSVTGTFTIGPGPSSQPPFATRHVQPGGSFLWAIAAGPSGLVAVGTGGTILSSADGVAWVRRDSGTTNWLVGVAYGGGQYIAVGDNGCILASPDGAAWVAVAQSATTQRLNNVVYGNGQFVAVGEAGTILSSPDGTNWTLRNSGLTGWLRALAFLSPETYEIGSFVESPGQFPSRFVASGQNGAIISSDDGIAWSNDGVRYGMAPFIAGVDVEALAEFQPGAFVGVGPGGALVASAWEQFSSHVGDSFPPTEYLDVVSVLDPVDLRGLVQGPGALFATGANGTILKADSGAGEYANYAGAWSQVASGTTVDLVAGVAVGDAVFVVGDNETILESTLPSDSRLTNLSCRSRAGTGEGALIAGFVVAGSGAGPIPLLIRASGPALGEFGVAGTLPDPELQLFSTASGSSLLAANDSWGGGSVLSDEAAGVGAFAWADSASHDAALFETLPAGPYTANITGESGDSGIALAEIYDATDLSLVSSSSLRLVNVSARAMVSSGNELIAGFVIGGSTPKTVLIRASGPALAPFGVAGTLPDPALQVFSTTGGSTLVASNTGWGGDPQVATASSWVGAFSWGLSATDDSAILVTLPPGTYTANVTGASGDSGIALIEVYEVK